MDDRASFGYWVRRRRKSLDLTQAELARRVNCAAKTIEKLEAGERRASKVMAERLAEALELALDARPAFLRGARGGWSVTAPTADWPAELPPPERPRSFAALPLQATPLIGRAREVAAVCAAFDDTSARLVTLIGPGGIGKTRVALQVAADLDASFADGAAFVDLAPITDPELVAATIAHALGAQDIDHKRLAVYLRDKHLLLVLDNVEQVTAAAPLIADLLAAAPQLKVLLTSRVVVGVYGEQLVEVPPLGYPASTLTAPDTLSVQQALEYEAMRLFAERARAVDAEFAVDVDNVVAVATICSRLEGLPLALELAAARIRLLSPQALLARLQPEDIQRLPFLTGGPQTLPRRQQTLRATIDWSYNLLSLHEQVLFRRLSVFVGGWSLEAAEAVCQVPGELSLDVLNELHSLLDKSLLHRRATVDGEPRFTMMETIREYAVEHLVASGERAVLQRRHAEYFLMLAEAADPTASGSQAGQRWNRLEREQDNFRAVFALSRTEATSETSLRLASALSGFWRGRGHLHEGYGWLKVAVKQSEAELSARPPTKRLRTLRALALDWLGCFALFQDDLEAAQPWLEESLRLFRDLGDRANVAEVLHDLGMMFVYRGDFGLGGPLIEESYALNCELGDAPAMAWSRFFIGVVAYSQGNLERASDVFRESLALVPAGEANWIRASILMQLGIVALDRGDDESATTYLLESLALFREQGEQWQTILVLEVVARLATGRGQVSREGSRAARRAAQMFGAAEALRETLSAPMARTYRENYQRGVAAAHAQLDDQTFAAAWAAGRAMSLEQAIAYALEERELQ